MQAYYNVLTTLKAKLEADVFVNTVTQGDIFDIDLTKQAIFPLSHIIVNDVTKVKNILQFNVTVMCMDIVDYSKDETTDIFLGNDNEQDVLNTQLAVALRLVELLERGSNNSKFMMRGEPTFEGFTERFENNLAGWAVTFDIHVPNTMTSCDDTATGAVCSPVNVENSDGSYIQSVASGSTLNLPDAGASVNGNTEGQIPSVQSFNIILQDGVGSLTPDSVGVTGTDITITLPDSASIPVGATLLKCQTTSYRTGDDGSTGRGRQVDFLTLPSNNPFGNTNRFTDTLGGQTYANGIVLDWSTYNGTTVLAWYISDADTPRTWDDAIDLCLTYNVDGFTGWAMPNLTEQESVLNKELTSWLNYSPFNRATGVNTSTSRSGSQMYLVIPQTGQIGPFSKSTSYRHYAVRYFTNLELSI